MMWTAVAAAAMASAAIAEGKIRAKYFQTQMACGIILCLILVIVTGKQKQTDFCSVDTANAIVNACKVAVLS